MRKADLVAAGFLALLGLAALAMILFLGLNEDARTFAALSASGWRDNRLGLAITVQALVIGLLGAALGMAAGLGLVRLVTGGLTRQMVEVSGLIAAAAVLACLVVAFAPALWLRRLPVARLLAED